MPDGTGLAAERPSRDLPLAMGDRLIVALDVPTVADARRIVAELDGIVSFFKIGMWLLFKPETNAFIDELVAAGKKLFLDYKMYDIGETVRQGVQSVAQRGISLVTVHGDEAIMRAAVAGKGSSDLMVFAITVLTSLDDAAVHAMGYRLTARELVELRVRQAVACGCDGIIASSDDRPDEIRTLAGSDGLLIATPGIRSAGEPPDDHKRFATPEEAIRRGADYLVVGRPILASGSHAATACRIVEEMAAGAR